MSKVPLNQHRKKKFGYAFKERESPFPVPISSITREDPNKNYWYHYTGQIQGDHVIVTNSGDISYLQRMGYFGKGLLSKGAPSGYQELPSVHIPTTEDGEPDVVHVMRRRRYLKHMKWKKSHDERLTNQGTSGGYHGVSDVPEDEEFDSDVDYSHTGYEQESNDSNCPQSNSGYNTNTSTVIENVPVYTNVTTVAEQQSSANQNISTWSRSEECSKQEVKDALWDSQTTNEIAAKDSWENMEADEDFWATEEVATNKNGNIEHSVSKTGERMIKNIDDCDVQISEKKRVQDNDLISVPHKKVKLSSNSDSPGDSSVTAESGSSIITHSAKLNLSNRPNMGSYTDKCNSEINELKSDQGENVQVEHELDKEREIVRTKTEVGTEVKLENGIEMEVSRGTGKPDSGNGAYNTHTEMVAIQPELLPIHPYCRYDDKDENDDDILGDENDMAIESGEEFLVIDDSDIDDSTYVVQRKDKFTWLPVRKKEIFNFNEPLMLSLYEAYFLSYGLGCLTVQDENKTNLSLTELWCRFCRKKYFLPQYVAYHYFRSKGWVPKHSVLFGTDFIVYKVGPDFYHASYSVIVKTVYEGTFEEVDAYNNGKVTWTSFFGICRVTEHVAKTLVYCYVIMPQDLSEEQMKSPDCISRFKVRLQTVQRWISSQDREKEKIVDDILDI